MSTDLLKSKHISAVVIILICPKVTGFQRENMELFVLLRLTSEIDHLRMFEIHLRKFKIQVITVC